MIENNRNGYLVTIMLVGTVQAQDEQDFARLYRDLPTGLTIAASRLENIEALQSLCFSLKGAAIRLGSNAMHFNFTYSKRNWLAKGMGHLRDFVEKHCAHGVNLFLLHQPTGYIDREVAELIREFALAHDIRVLVTKIAGREDKTNNTWIAALVRGAMSFYSAPAIAVRGKVLEDGFYGATFVVGGKEQYYGPLYFVSTCPQPPEGFAA